MAITAEREQAIALPYSERIAERPEPGEVRGRCVMCGELVVSRCDYDAEREAYILAWHCWAALTDGSCDWCQIL
jgi:hypothetical protein